MPARRGATTALFVLVGAAIVAGLLWQLSRVESPAVIAKATTRPATQPAEFAEGAQLYGQYCFTCHGIQADGNGPAATVLDPRPRNFHIGRYKLVSSSNSVPFRDDVIRTIRNGMAGTSMPAWKFFTDAQVEALADYVLAISRQALREDLIKRKVKPPTLDKIVTARMTATEKVTIPPEPAVTQADLIKAKALFDVTCAKCHEVDGSGRADASWKTDEGWPIASRNFTSHVYKGGGSSADLYTRIYAGMPGTPMAAFNSMSPEDIWRIVHYVQWLGDARHTKPDPSAYASQQASQQGN